MRAKTAFLADENVARSTVEMLRRRGFEARRAQEAGLSGKPDDAVLRYAARKNLVVLTMDKDFGALIQNPVSAGARVVLFRLRDMRPASVNRRFETALPVLDKAMRDYGLAVVSDGHIRLRK